MIHTWKKCFSSISILLLMSYLLQNKKTLKGCQGGENRNASWTKILCWLLLVSLLLLLSKAMHFPLEREMQAKSKRMHLQRRSFSFSQTSIPEFASFYILHLENCFLSSSREGEEDPFFKTRNHWTGQRDTRDTVFDDREKETHRCLSFPLMDHKWGVQEKKEEGTDKDENLKNTRRRDQNNMWDTILVLFFSIPLLFTFCSLVSWTKLRWNAFKPLCLHLILLLSLPSASFVGQDMSVVFVLLKLNFFSCPHLLCLLLPLNFPSLQRFFPMTDSKLCLQK